MKSLRQVWAAAQRTLSRSDQKNSQGAKRDLTVDSQKINMEQHQPVFHTFYTNPKSCKAFRLAALLHSLFAHFCASYTTVTLALTDTLPERMPVALAASLFITPMSAMPLTA